jgi:hypothetical protein
MISEADMDHSEKRFFPCPVCVNGLDVRKSKKGRPYIVCDRCGVQMFVRNDSGIQAFERLTAEADQQDLWKRLADLQARYQKTCPECYRKFWINYESISTDWLDGKLLGFLCPEPGCKGVVHPQ